MPNSLNTFEVLGSCERCGIDDATINYARLASDGTRTDEQKLCQACVSDLQAELLRAAMPRKCASPRKHDVRIEYEGEMYLRADHAAKALNVTMSRLLQYLSADYSGMRMRTIKLGKRYVHEGDLKSFTPLPRNSGKTTSVQFEPENTRIKLQSSDARFYTPFLQLMQVLGVTFDQREKHTQVESQVDLQLRIVKGAFSLVLTARKEPA